jgi:hypothetical protein
MLACLLTENARYAALTMLTSQEAAARARLEAAQWEAMVVLLHASAERQPKRLEVQASRRCALEVETLLWQETAARVSLHTAAEVAAVFLSVGFSRFVIKDLAQPAFLSSMPTVTFEVPDRAGL